MFLVCTVVREHALESKEGTISRKSSHGTTIVKQAGGVIVCDVSHILTIPSSAADASPTQTFGILHKYYASKCPFTKCIFI